MICTCNNDMAYDDSHFRDCASIFTFDALHRYNSDEMIHNFWWVSSVHVNNNDISYQRPNNFIIRIVSVSFECSTRTNCLFLRFFHSLTCSIISEVANSRWIFAINVLTNYCSFFIFFLSSASKYFEFTQNHFFVHLFHRTLLLHLSSKVFVY